ncbi:MAG TPA: alpha/beta fold hydrolase, partial [Solirubrobacteraceae bacterium]
MGTAVPEPIVLEDIADAVEAGELVGGFSPSAAMRSLWTAAHRSPGLGRRAAALAAETAKILVGSDGVAPKKGDWRFRDDAWRDNPAYRRVMQSYLAGCEALEGAVESADIGWRDKERARFAAAILTSAVAPTNTLVGNPAAVKRAYETGGLSLLRGTRNFVRDMRSNRGMPSTVNREGFTVGKDLAATPGAVVYRDDVCEVLQYTPSTGTVRSRPVLMVPPQISKYYFMDLSPGRSFVEHAVGHGLPFFVISWRNVTADQRDWGLETYAAAIDRVLDVVRDVAQSDDVNLISLCAGGITTSTVLSHLAATGDPRVHSASFGVTLLDFGVPAPIGMFRMAPLLALARERSARTGFLDAASLSAVFSWMRPNDLVWNYWVNNYLMGNDPPVFDILAWNADSTNLAGRLHADFLELMQENLLVTKGELEVLGTPVDLEKVTVDTYVTGATTDHLTPWRGCYQTTQLMSGRSRFVLSNAGHIASLVNPPGNPKAHFFAGPEPMEDADEWLARAEQRSGTWWDDWATWVSERSGEEKKAPAKLGSRRHRAGEPAP